MSTAVVFPGQGSQIVGMCSELAAVYPVVRATLTEADEALGMPLSALMASGPAEKLAATVNCQPALLAAGVAQFRLLQHLGLRNVACMAGHSLGEYTALVCAEALDFPSALRLVQDRGRFMQDAMPLGTGRMTAILGWEIERVLKIINTLSLSSTIQIANHNAKQQVVVSGLSADIQTLESKLDQLGATCFPLRVSAPFHSIHMSPAAVALSERLNSEELQWKTCRVDVYSNVTAAPHRDAESIPHLLERQIIETVHWLTIMERFQERGVRRIIECGPGNVLIRLLKSHNPKWKLFSSSLPDEVEALRPHIQPSADMVDGSLDANMIELLGRAVHTLVTTPNLETDDSIYESSVAVPLRTLRMAYKQWRRGKGDPTSLSVSDIRAMTRAALTAKALPQKQIDDKLRYLDSGLITSSGLSAVHRFVKPVTQEGN